MKVTIYELLGMVKDGKAPKRIKQIFDDGFKEEYILDNEGWYETLDGTTKMNIFKVDRLNSIVEILEEEKKIPEKLIPTSLKGIDNLDEKIEIAHIDTISVIETVNQVIDYLKSKGE